MANIETIKPDANGVFPGRLIDISLVNNGLVFDVSGSDWDYIVIQMTYEGSVTIGSAVNKIQISIDGRNPQDFSGGAVTLSTAGITSLQRITGYSFVHSTFTTPGTSGNVRLSARAARHNGGVV